MLTKPFFSRKQLSIIIVVTTLAIAVLSTTGPGPLPTIEKIEIAGNPLYYIDKSDPVGRLRLSFRLPNHGHSSQFQPQLMYQMITDRLKQQSISPADGWPPISVNLQHNRLQLQINADEPPPLEQLIQLIQWLNDEIPSQQWDAAAKRLQADRYIQQNSNPSVLTQIAPLIGIELSPENAETYHSYQQQLINRSQLSISYVGPDADNWMQATSAMLEFLPQARSTSEQAFFWPYAIKKNQQPKGYEAILARKTEGYADGATLEQAAIYLIRSALMSQERSDWQARDSAGLLLITSRDQTADALLNSLKRRLFELAPKEIQSRLEQSVDELEMIADNHQQLLNRVERVALYNLPLDYLPKLAAELASLDPAAVQEESLALLTKEELFWISR